MPDAPHRTDLKQAEQAARAERLAQALRDNLRRRKQQARDRADTDAAAMAEARQRGSEPPA